jgi:hypothetical protein
MPVHAPVTQTAPGRPARRLRGQRGHASRVALLCAYLQQLPQRCAALGEFSAGWWGIGARGCTRSSVHGHTVPTGTCCRAYHRGRAQQHDCSLARRCGADLGGATEAALCLLCLAAPETAGAGAWGCCCSCCAAALTATPTSRAARDIPLDQTTALHGKGAGLACACSRARCCAQGGGQQPATHKGGGPKTIPVNGGPGRVSDRGPEQHTLSAR